MKKAGFFIFVSVMMVSCYSSQEKGGSILLQDVPTSDITTLFRETGFPKDLIGRPEFMLVLDDYIILSASDEEYTALAYNINTGHFKRVGRKGRGPEEVLNVNQIGVYPDHDKIAFYLHDNLSKKIFVYSIYDGEVELWKILSMTDFKTFDFDASMTVGVNSDDQSRFLIVDTLRNTKKAFGDYSEYGLDMKEGAMIYQGLCITNDKTKRCAWFSYYGEAFNIIDYSDINNVKIPARGIYQDVITADSAGALSPETKFGFTSLTGNDRYIISLCCDKSLKDFMTLNGVADPRSSNHLCVFDWDGTYVKHLYSDRPIKCININKKTNELYAVILDEDLLYKVVSYPINSIL